MTSPEMPAGQCPEEEAGFRQLIEQIADAVLVLRTDGEIRYANPAAERLMGRPSADLIGTPFGQPVAPGETAELDIARTNADGTSEVRIVEMRCGPILWGERLAVLASLRDITARRRNSLAIRFLAEAGRELADSLDENVILRAVARLAVSQFGPGVVIDLDGGHGGLTPRSAEGLTTAPVPEGESDARLIAWREARTLGGMIGEPTAPNFCRTDAFSYFASVPMLTGGRAIGTLTLLRGVGEPAFSAEQMELAEEFARRAAAALENARNFRESQEENQRKSEFLAMLGHELRNPLSAIRTAMEVHRMELPQGRRTPSPSLEVIDRQMTHITRLVDDLLEVSRITRGRIELRKQRLDLGSFVSRLGPTCTPLVRDRGLWLSVHVPPGPVWINADPDRLEQILCNLLHNAAKYTETGGRIEIEMVTREGEAELRVRDDGAGINAELLPHLFEPFRCGPQSLDRSRGGLGIGLTLVKGLTELHGGRVRAFSEGEGRGSEFVVTLPLVVVEQAWADSHSPQDTPCCGTTRRVLLVEDNRDSREMLQQLLVSLGHEVSVAADGPSGLELALRTRPEAAVIDIGLPGLDGYQVARAIREAETGHPHRGYLIALTGYGLPSDVEEARAAGFDLHMVKPLDVERLLGVFEALPNGR